MVGRLSFPRLRKHHRPNQTLLVQPTTKLPGRDSVPLLRTTTRPVGTY